MACYYGLILISSSSSSLNLKIQATVLAILEINTKIYIYIYTIFTPDLWHCFHKSRHIFQQNNTEWPRKAETSACLTYVGLSKASGVRLGHSNSVPIYDWIYGNRVKNLWACFWKIGEMYIIGQARALYWQTIGSNREGTKKTRGRYSPNTVPSKPGRRNLLHD